MSILDPAFPPVTSVLAATDLQHSSREVLAAATAVARANGARLHLIHVLTPAAVARTSLSRDPAAEAAALEEAQRGLAIQEEELRRGGVDVASALVARERSAHDAIAQQAAAVKADVIVMGSHARSTTSHRLGSTADRVLRTVQVPCLVVRGEARFPLHRVAVLTDFSPTARVGLRVAFSWLPVLGLADPEGSVDVLHVGWPEPPPPAAVADKGMVERLEKEIALASANVTRMPTTVRPRVVWNFYPAEAAVREAKLQDYQLLVAATHGHGTIALGLLGSETLGIMHSSPCPVLAVPHHLRQQR